MVSFRMPVFEEEGGSVLSNVSVYLILLSATLLAVTVVALRYYVDFRIKQVLRSTVLRVLKKQARI